MEIIMGIKIKIAFILLLIVSTVISQEDINIREKVLKISDSIFHKELGTVTYSKVKDSLMFGLNFTLDASGSVKKITFVPLSSKSKLFKKEIKKISKILLNLDTRAYYNETRLYGKHITSFKISVNLNKIPFIDDNVFIKKKCSLRRRSIN